MTDRADVVGHLPGRGDDGGEQSHDGRDYAGARPSNASSCFAGRPCAARRRRVPLCQALNTAGLMYDLRQTAGVLRRPAATSLTTALMQRRIAASRAPLRHRHVVEQRQRVQRGVPGAEILGREIAAHAFAQIVVDLSRIDGAPIALLVDVLEQRLARQFLAAAHELREACIFDQHVVLRAALAAELQQRLAARREARMTVAQCGQAEAAVAARVLGIADAHLGGIQQLHHQRENLLARQARALQIATHGGSQMAQRLAEAQHARVLVIITRDAPVGVIAILLAAARVASRRLQVTARIGADPDVFIRRRYRELRDARQCARLTDAPA